MRSPRVYQLNFIIKRKKEGVLKPYLELQTQRNGPSIRVPTASDVLRYQIQYGRSRI